jgi:hypothetical protein
MLIAILSRRARYIVLTGRETPENGSRRLITIGGAADQHAVGSLENFLSYAR